MNSELKIDGVSIDEIGIDTNRTDLTEQELDDILSYACRKTSAAKWLVADTLLLLERSWGNQHVQSKYTDIMDKTGLAAATLYNMAATAKYIPHACRHNGLSFTHHQELAHCYTNGDEDTIKSKLETAYKEKMSCSAFRKWLRVNAGEHDTAKETDRLKIVELLWSKRRVVTALADNIESLGFNDVRDAMAAFEPCVKVFQRLEARYLFLQNAADGQQDHIIEKAIDKAEKKRNVK